ARPHHVADKLGWLHSFCRADGRLRHGDGSAVRVDRDLLALLSSACADYRAVPADIRGRLFRIGTVAGAIASLDALVAVRTWHAADALGLLSGVRVAGCQPGLFPDLAGFPDGGRPGGRASGPPQCPADVR